MSELGERLSPTILQTDLVRVYKSMPAFSAIPGRIARIRGELDPQTPNPDQEGFFRLITHSKTAELSKEKLELLEKLLSIAQITATSKHEISLQFGMNFAFGLGHDDTDIFRIIGVTDENRMETGIFSLDPRTRMAIERSIYQGEKQALEEITSDTGGFKLDPVGHIELIREQMQELADFRMQFEELYGEPIELPVSQ